MLFNEKHKKTLKRKSHEAGAQLHVLQKYIC